MKKSLLLLGVAVAAITSCTNDEVLEMNPQTTISFDSHVNKSTRAVTETTSALSQFYVFGEKGANENYGTSVFNNVAATDDAATSQVWTRSMYSFGAYATKNVSGQFNNVAFDAKNGKLTFTNYTVDDTEDLVAAVVKVNNTNGDKQQTVDLQFKHLLSQVMFEIENGIDNYSMKVTNITLKNVATKGTCEFDGATKWTPASDVNNKVFAQYWDGVSSYKAINGLSLAKDESVKTEAFFVIPNQVFTPALPANPIVADITVEFWDGAVQVSTNTFENVSVVLPSDAKWTAGYKYVYSARVADANTEYITFNVKTVEAWQDGTTSDVTLN